MARHQFSTRTRIRVSQLTDAQMHSIHQEFCRRLRLSHKHCIIDPNFLINMDETTVSLNGSPTPTVLIKGEKAVSVIK